MSGLINLIKSIFGGIFSFIGGLFGGKKAAIESANGDAPKTRKSTGYFLELDDTAQPAKPKTSVAVAEKPVAADAPETSKKSAKKAELLAANGSKPAETAPLPVASVAVAIAPKEPQTVEFATKYLIPSGNGGRRRPGANMNSYLDMARDMKAGSN
ncbi:MAG: hypothetical protein HC780_18780 [Leptolyngbyaceae cyanobacterium CSU_1_3]|nr:hypothetical protein [Leptolyngbyaceae cyanobacterium CSU_1_3]